MGALLFCQFLGIKHSIVHGFTNTYSTIANVAPSSNIRFDNFLDQQPSPVEHHCCAWDHATLSIGAISASSPSFFVQTTFELKPHHPRPFFLRPPLFSYLSRAPPLPA
jgi:hypothetical protein